MSSSLRSKLDELASSFANDVLHAIRLASIEDLLAEVRARRGMTVIVVSYDPQVGERADRMVTVTDGVLTQPATGLSAAPCA